MGIALKDLKAKTSAPERTHKVCLNGQLRAEHDLLREELDELTGSRAKMGPSERERELTEQLQALEARMEEDTVTFRFRGLSHWRLKEIMKSFPPEEGSKETWDVSAGATTLISESLVDPKLTKEETREWLEQGNAHLTDELFVAAWVTSNQETAVPKSARVSGRTGGSGSK